MNYRITKMMIFVAIALAALIPSAAFGQQPTAEQQAEQQKRVAEFKQAVQQSMAALHKYEWVETTTVSLKGEVKSQKQNRVYYGADGKLQKVPIGEAPPQQQQQSGGRGGRLKAKVVAKKKEEMSDYMKKAVELVHKYTPPDPNLIKYSKEVGKVNVEQVEPNRIVRVTLRDLIKTGDSLTATLNVQSNAIMDINVSTYLESPKDDPITLAVTMSQLADGASYTARSVLDAKAKNITVVVESSGHRPL